MASSKLSGPLLLVTACLFACQVKPNDDTMEHSDAPISVEDAPELLAQRLCAQMLECECATPFTDAAACEEAVSAALRARIDPVLDAGGSWNDECAGKFSKAVADWECLGPTMASWQGIFEPRICPLLQGTVDFGQDCSYSVFNDQCAAGLSCISSLCYDAVTLPVPLGGSCELGWESLPCEAGSYCEYDYVTGVRTCADVPEEGDACSVDVGVCGPSGNLICEAGTCVLAPGEGEPCYNGYLCGPDLYCDGGQDLTCQPRRQLGEGCGADSVCPVDASCLANICEADPPAVCNVMQWLF